jgi:hypothetical protein
MRNKDEILSLIDECKKNIVNIENNQHKFLDPGVSLNMILENQNRIHTLEWVLGEHERYD